MADWSEPQQGIVAVLQKLAPGSTLVVLRTGPEVRMQFSATPDGNELRAEVSNEVPDVDERIGERGWELIDEWSGVWRRSVPAAASNDDVTKLVAEALFLVKGRWGQARSDEFGYLAWRDVGQRPWWQFWKPKGEVDLKFPELGLRRSAAPDPNS